MKTPHRWKTRENEFEYFTPSAKEGVLFIRSLQDEELEDFDAVRKEFPPETNQEWIWARMVDERQGRGLIDDATHYQLSEFGCPNY